MDLLPLWYILTMSFIAGAIIGSFLNVYLYRFHTGKSLAGNSHCLSCGERLRWYDLVPVISFFILRGRCRDCSARIPARYALVELATGGLFLLTVWQFGLTWLLPLQLLLAVLIICTVVYDLYHFIIPNEFVWAFAATGAALLAIALYDDPSWWAESLDAILGVLVAAGFYGALWLVSRGRWLGLGDVKLAAPLGLLVGLHGVYSFIIFSFWIGAVISVAYLLWQRWYRGGQLRLPFTRSQLTIKSEVPFAPFLLLSFIVVYYFGVDVLDWVWYALV